MCGLGKATSGQKLPARLSRYRGCVESDVPHLNHAALSAGAPRKRHKPELLELQLLAAHIAPNLRLSRVNVNRGTRGTIVPVNNCLIAANLEKRKKNGKQSSYWISRYRWVLGNGGKRIVWNNVTHWLQSCTSQMFHLFLYVIWCSDFVALILKSFFLFFLFTEKEQQEAIEHIDEVQNEIDR